MENGKELKRQTTGLDAFAGIKNRFIELADPETFKKEASFALQHFNKNPYLNQATTESKLEAVLNVAQVGLSLNPVKKEAYLVPRRRNVGTYDNPKWIVECHLEPSHMGLMKLVTDTGSAVSIQSHVVYEGDIFEVSLGTSPDVKHIPKYESKEMIHVYMVAKMHDGAFQVEVMTRQEVEEIRENSESYKSYLKGGKKIPCIWVDHFGEMARKTVIRRGVKQLKKTNMWDKLAHAIQLDESDYQASAMQIHMVESLLMNAAIEEEEKADLYRECPTMSYSRASDVIEYLKNNQVDSLNGFGNYSVTDAADAVAEKLKEDED